MKAKMEKAPQINWEEFTAKFKWKQGEHVTLIGPTGCGKSTVAKEILPRRDFICVFVTKKRDKTLDELQKELKAERFREPFFNPDVAPRFLLHPKMEHGKKNIANQREQFEEALETIFRQEGWTLYLDECRYITDNLNLSTDVELLLQQGRSLGVTVVLCTQRPRKVPLEAYSQATHIFLWGDNDKGNIQRLSELNSRDTESVKRLVPLLGLHEFLYVNTRGKGEMYRSKVEGA